MPLRLRQIVVVFAVATAAGAAPACAAGVVAVNAPWVRPANAGKTTEAYFSLTASEGGRLIGAESPRAARVTLNDSGARKPVREALTLPPGTEVVFAPGRIHLTLHDLTQAFKPGERVPIMLTIESLSGARQDIPVDAEVRNESPIDAERRHHHKVEPPKP